VVLELRVSAFVRFLVSVTRMASNVVCADERAWESGCDSSEESCGDEVGEEVYAYPRGPSFSVTGDAEASLVSDDSGKLALLFRIKRVFD